MRRYLPIILVLISVLAGCKKALPQEGKEQMRILNQLALHTPSLSTHTETIRPMTKGYAILIEAKATPDFPEPCAYWAHEGIQ